MDFEELRSPRAIVCQKEHRADCGVGIVWLVLLADGYLIDCGSQPASQARANTLASIVNAGGPEQLSHTSLREWRQA